MKRHFESVMTFMKNKVLNGLTNYAMKYWHNNERGPKLSHNVKKEPIEDVVGKKRKIKAYENYL